MLYLLHKRHLLIQTVLLCYVSSCELPFVSKGFYCVHVTEPKSFDDGCDIKDYSNFDAELYASIGVLVWLPVKRKYKFGPMVYETPGDQFYEEFKMQQYYQLDEDFIEKDCMLVLNYTVVYVDCSEKHPHLCLYAKKESFCDIDFTDIQSCLCNVERIDSDYQDEDEDDCELSSEFSTTPSDLKYFKVPDPGALSASYSQFSANCPTCKVRVLDIPKVDLVLNFETRTKRLFLTVYSPEGIFYDGNTQSIYCFTDAAEKIEKSVEMNFTIGVFSNTSRNREVYELDLEDYVGNYWCEGFQLPTLSLIRSNKVLAYKREGSEFALMLHHNNSFSQYPCNVDGLNLFVFPVLKRILHNYVKKLRLMEVAQIQLYNRTCQMDFIVHATRREGEDFSNYTQFAAEMYYSGHVRIIYVANAIYCNEEHVTLSWPRACIGEGVTSLEICINEEGIPVRRLCGGNFIYGAQWLEPQGYCSDVSNVSMQTLQLHNITLQKMERNVSKEVVRLSGETHVSSALDIEYFSNVLNKMFQLRQNSSDYVFDVTEVIDNVMENDFEALKQSQVMFNATDNILRICEALYEDTQILQNVTFFHMKRKNYFVQITKPFYTNVSGIAIYGDNSSNLQVSNINFTDTIPKFTDNLILATLLPNDSFYNNTENLTIIITVFFQDKLFIDIKNSSNVTSGNIVSIVAPHHGGYLRKPIKVWFGSNGAQRGHCVFWDYGDRFHKKSGSWSDIGGSFIRTIDNGSVVECEYSHLTPFALLVLTERNEVDNVSYNIIFDGDVNHYVYLNVITLIGTVMSATGIGIIFLTALLFPEWRTIVGSKILLQLSLVILLEVILAQVADMHNVKDSAACAAVGIILHYIVCSKFCWMFVFAVLQYSRFVTVLGARPSHLVLKAAAIGWLLPVLPVVIAISFSLASYSAGTFMFCYPKGLALILGLLVPITLIVAFNIFAFIFIIYKVNSTTKQNEKRRQIVLAVLLFFMLGIPWLFGLLIELFEGTWLHYFCAYMFCITATLQGFVLFVFYILLNSEVRTKWKYFLCGKTANETNLLI